MATRKYLNLFKQFNNINSESYLISQNVFKVTKNIYKEPNDLIKFNILNYKNLYRDWGQLGIFNHIENEISPLTYGMLGENAFI